MKLISILGSLVLLAATGYAGEQYSTREIHQRETTAPSCEWYRDTEWNLSVWGIYEFADEEDDYVQSNDAWGAGMEMKYFFRRYFGVGLQGWVLSADREVLDISGVGVPGDFVILDDNTRDETRAVGALLATFTLRFPIGCSRFAPYLFAGGGVIFGGGESDELVFIPPPLIGTFFTQHHEGDPEAIGQVGAGFEVRITPTIGWINDISLNAAGDADSTFGMVRSGINFTF